jgi:hypothetical protein
MSFQFAYPIKRVLNNPYNTGDLLTHTQMNELGQNLQDLGDYVGNPASVHRTKNGNQTLTTNSIITNWTNTSITDPFNVFTLGTNSITINFDGLYTISYAIRISHLNTGPGQDYLIYTELQFDSGSFVRAKSGAAGYANTGVWFLAFTNSQICQYFTAGTVVKLNVFDVFNRSTILEGGNTTWTIARQG